MKNAMPSLGSLLAAELTAESPPGWFEHEIVVEQECPGRTDHGRAHNGRQRTHSYMGDCKYGRIDDGCQTGNA
jgi:hypothetical protein